MDHTDTCPSWVAEHSWEEKGRQEAADDSQVKIRADIHGFRRFGAQTTRVIEVSTDLVAESVPFLALSFHLASALNREKTGCLRKTANFEE